MPKLRVGVLSRYLRSGHQRPYRHHPSVPCDWSTGWSSASPATSARDRCFSIEERVALVREEVAAAVPRRREGAHRGCGPFDTLLMHFVETVRRSGHQSAACAPSSDFEYEFQMAGMNAPPQFPRSKTIFLMASDRHPVHLVALRQGDRPPSAAEIRHFSSRPGVAAPPRAALRRGASAEPEGQGSACRRSRSRDGAASRAVSEVTEPGW